MVWPTDIRWQLIIGLPTKDNIEKGDVLSNLRNVVNELKKLSRMKKYKLLNYSIKATSF